MSLSPSYETVASILGPSGSAPAGLDLQEGKDQTETASSEVALAPSLRRKHTGMKKWPPLTAADITEIATGEEEAAPEEGRGRGSAGGSAERQDGG